MHPGLPPICTSTGNSRSWSSIGACSRRPGIAPVPLLERLRFLAISCSNLDEFFEIRVAGLKQRRELGSRSGGPDGMDVDDAARRDPRRSRRADRRAVRAAERRACGPRCSDDGIRMLARARTGRRAAPIGSSGYFDHEVEPVLTPLGLDPARPFPRIQNKSLNFIVELVGQRRLRPRRRRSRSCRCPARCRG